jgi:sulfatase maturation enzyme AslB (radical SAM superfamily)
MDLIIKPTQRCNFSCTFCSSTEIAKSNKPVDDLELERVGQFLDRYPDTRTIIVNGGDPLMMKPDYYWEMLQMLEDRGMTECVVSFTTNLWDYFLHPKKWRELFNHPQLQVGTSFHYGESRQIAPGQVFTEEKFLKVMEMFHADFNYYPSFISVITEENRHLALNNVRLAKFLGTECKMNYAMASGREGKPFPMGDMYKIYMEVYDAGLAEWEYNTKQMLDRLHLRETTTCPQNRRCDEGIRNLQPKSDTGFEYSSCGSLADDQEFPIDFDKEMAGEFFTPLQDTFEIQYQKEECLSCPNFNICNGCYKTVKDLKESGLVEHSCKLMKEFRVWARENDLTKN